MPSEQVKSITLYVNGDRRSTGRKMVVNKKQSRTFDAFLEQVTQRLRPSFGAILTICSVDDWKRISSLDELQTGKCYVVAGREKLVKLEYRKIRDQSPVRELPDEKRSSRRPVVSGRRDKSVPDRKYIFVYANGNDQENAHRVLLVRSELQTWEAALRAISERVKLRSSAIQYLYTMEGEQVMNLMDIAIGEYYVAVGSEKKFKDIDYRKPSTPKLPKRARVLPSVKKRNGAKSDTPASETPASENSSMEPSSTASPPEGDSRQDSRQHDIEPESEPNGQQTEDEREDNTSQTRDRDSPRHSPRDSPRHSPHDSPHHSPRDSPRDSPRHNGILEEERHSPEHTEENETQRNGTDGHHGETDLDDKEQKQDAAIKIQAGMRGMRDRRKVKQIRKNREDA